MYYFLRLDSLPTFCLRCSHVYSIVPTTLNVSDNSDGSGRINGSEHSEELGAL